MAKRLPVFHGKVELFESRAATWAELERVHPAAWLRVIQAACARAGEEGTVHHLDPDTPVSGASWEAALGSTGSALDAVERVARGELRNAFVATRPPGHHAESERAMGFCLLNHIAVAARHLQALGLARNIAIVDWDVHHGNGTQAIFYSDPTVYFLSLHQDRLFPDGGGAEETGVGAGAGWTLNLPLPPGLEGPTYLASFRRGLAQAREAMRPDFILISAGYDTLAGDPLGGMRLEPSDTFDLTREVMAWAEEACGGRVVALLEGGYDPRRTGEGVVATVGALAGLSSPP